MTTIKTPLPEKLPRLPYTIAHRYSGEVLDRHTLEMTTINQLIDYLAELREVVEGKQDRTVVEIGHSGGSFATAGTNQNVPALKDRLLGAKKRVLIVADSGEVVPQDVIFLSDVNKLMP